MPLRAPTKTYGYQGSGTGGYSGLGIISTVREEKADLARLFGRRFISTGLRDRLRHRVVLSLGKRVVPVLKQGVGLPTLVSGTVGTEETGIPAPIDRRDIAPTSEGVPIFAETLIATTEEEYAKLVALYPHNPVVYQPVAETVTEPVLVAPEPVLAPPINNTTSGGSMDLGSIITDLGTSYIQAKYAPKPQVQAQPAYSLPQLGGDIVDFFSDPATGQIIPVKKKKPCRRRRKRLATKSDLGDLAALKAILGNGEAFKAWIATHSR